MAKQKFQSDKDLLNHLISERDKARKVRRNLILQKDNHTVKVLHAAKIDKAEREVRLAELHLRRFKQMLTTIPNQKIALLDHITMAFKESNSAILRCYTTTSSMIKIGGDILEKMASIKVEPSMEDDVKQKYKFAKLYHQALLNVLVSTQFDEFFLSRQIKATNDLMTLIQIECNFHHLYTIPANAFSVPMSAATTEFKNYFDDTLDKLLKTSQSQDTKQIEVSNAAMGNSR